MAEELPRSLGVEILPVNSSVINIAGRARGRVPRNRPARLTPHVARQYARTGGNGKGEREGHCTLYHHGRFGFFS